MGPDFPTPKAICTHYFTSSVKLQLRSSGVRQEQKSSSDDRLTALLIGGGLRENDDPADADEDDQSGEIGNLDQPAALVGGLQGADQRHDRGGGFARAKGWLAVGADRVDEGARLLVFHRAVSQAEVLRRVGIRPVSQRHRDHLLRA